MPYNEGILSKHELGGEHVYTEDHTPVILAGKLKAEHTEIKVGSVLVIDTDGINVISTNNTLPIIGVSDEDVAVDSDQTYVSYVAHGTVKSQMLKGTNGVVFTDNVKLSSLGIYAI